MSSFLIATISSLSFIRSVSSRDGWSVSKRVRPNIESHRRFDHHAYTVFSLSCTLSELNQSLRGMVSLQNCRESSWGLPISLSALWVSLTGAWIEIGLENRHHNLFVFVGVAQFSPLLPNPESKFFICTLFIINLLGCTRRRKNRVKRNFLLKASLAALVDFLPFEYSRALTSSFSLFFFFFFFTIENYITS